MLKNISKSCFKCL